MGIIWALPALPRIRPSKLISRWITTSAAPDALLPATTISARQRETSTTGTILPCQLSERWYGPRTMESWATRRHSAQALSWTCGRDLTGLSPTGRALVMDFNLTSLGLPASLATYAGQGSEPLFPSFSIQNYSGLGPPGGSYYASHNTD